MHQIHRIPQSEFVLHSHVHECGKLETARIIKSYDNTSYAHHDQLHDETPKPLVLEKVISCHHDSGVLI